MPGGCLYYVGPKKEEKREVVVDPERRRQVFLESHFTEIGNHLGQKKTVHRIQSRYYWLGIVKDVVDWIKMCETCQNTEHGKSLLKKSRPVKVESPWEVLGLDVYAFTNYVIRLLLERWNISQLLTPSDPANCTSLDSRTNELLKSSICNLVHEKPSEWDDSLDPVLFGFRTTVSSVTKYTPFFLLYNRYACLSSEAAYIKDSSKEQGTNPFKSNGLPSFSAAVQEQQNAVKEIVIANMAAAYKQEQKSIKRKTRGLSSLPYKMEDGVFESNDDQAVKRLKKNQFVSFHIETVLPPEQSISSMKKTG
ncbi:hypothetical protein JD844_014895 [Phrynosoma platyrhinos]|uniref:Gypsy retrotransposon integrase-like protein 1 n=1 Tax=Phrynosoma platyrhinos TaxID=52577 RepID=A0ABQ7T6R5_PHRPL|nr:hypothetical protein JD844_014895 [Phrynosoma platyrhinos]